MQLDRWIMKQQPTTVRAIDRKGQSHDIAVAKSGNRWARAARAVAAVEAVKCLALNPKGECIEAIDLDTGEETADEATDSKGKPLQKGTAHAIADALPQLFKAHTEGCDAAMGRLENAYRLAFDQLLALVKLYGDRLASLEKAWHRLLLSGGAGEDSPDALAAKVLEAAITKHMTPEKPEGKPNGEKKTE